MTVRMRVQAGTPGGIVAAPFLYDTQRENPPGTLVRDEIDHEILTNNAQTAGPDNTLTNVWNDGNSASPGAPVTISNPAGFDVTQFHDYRTDWTPTSVKWYIDNSLVPTETSVVPDDPMRAHINFWAPDSNFAAAYNAALQPIGHFARHELQRRSRSDANRADSTRRSAIICWSMEVSKTSALGSQRHGWLAAL